MTMYIIDAIIHGETVTLYHRPSTQKIVDMWIKDNQPRLIQKGFHSFQVDKYNDNDDIF